MPHASILDAFNSFADFGTRGLNTLDKINTEKANAELQTASLSMQKEFDDYLMNINNRADFDSFMQDWENQKVKILNDVTAGLSSPYAKEQASALFKQMDLNQQEKIAAQTMKRKADYTYTTTQNNNNTIMSSLAYTAEQKLTMTQGNWKRLYDSGIMSYEDYNQKIMNNGAAIALDSIQNGAREAMKTGGIDAAMKYIQTNQERLVLVNGAEVPMDNVRDAAQKNIMLEWQTSEALRKQKQEEVWYSNENKTSQIYLRMLSGEGVSAAYEGLQYLKNLGSNGLDANRRDEYAQKFQSYIEDALKDPKGASDKAKLNLSVDQMVSFWQAGGITAEQGKDVLLKNLQSEMNKQIADVDRSIASGKKIDTTDIDRARGKTVMEVYPTVLNDYFDAIQKTAPAPIQDYVKNIKQTSESIFRTAKNINQKTKLNNEQETQLTTLQADLAGYCIDLVNESKFGELTADQLNKKVTERINLAVAKQYDILQTGLKDRMFYPVEKQAADLQRQLDTGSDPVFVDTYGRENYVGTTKKGIDDLRNYQRNQIAKKIGLSEKDVGRISVTSEPTADGRDTNGSAIFTDNATGSKYRFRTDESGKMSGYELKAGSRDWSPFDLPKDQKKAADRSAAAETAIIAKNAYKEPIPGYSQAEWDRLPDADKFSKWEEYRRQQYNNRNASSAVRTSAGGR